MTTICSTATPDDDPRTSRLLRKLSSLVDSYTSQHQTRSALFWSGQMVTFSGERPDCVLRHSEALSMDGQFQRAAHAIRSRNLDKESARAAYLAAKATFDAKEPEEALQIIEAAAEVIEAAQKAIEDEKAAGNGELRQVRLKT
jgi:hypothetical protein